ncbi:MAG: malto-oligosyltrehalose trehalohydrolase [Myxococcota bacterium]|nr:malto-oligosyltrehalose trehalohydrolase [Myxococcota bacterium]
MSGAFRLTRGAWPDPDGGVRFATWAPRADKVAVRVLREGRPVGELPLERGEGGVFEGHVPWAAAGDDYVYVLDERARPDPVSRLQPHGVHGPSRVVDPDAFGWTDAGFPGVPRPDLVFYEVHVGTFHPRGSFEGVAERLAELRELGVTALELMPVAAFPGRRNWGYDGVFPYAVQASYGGPEGLKRLVDAAHAAGLGVFLDVVYNHLGPEGNVLQDFGPYFTDRVRTPWGDALNFDGPGSDEVRRYFIDNALHWVAEYHVDGLRLDAVHAIVDTSARPFLEELARAVHDLAASLGREVHVIAESDANDPRLVRPRERGGLGLDGVWSDDFHHALHALLTGEREGYYGDYGGVGDLAKALRDHFVYDGRPSAFRGRRHGAPARDVPADRFVVCAQNHDQIGNRARGERLTALVDPAGCRLAAAAVLLAPALPLLFMGEEWGETAPFLYFVDHQDPELLEAVRRGRRQEFSAFEWAEEVPDPAAEATFLRSRVAPPGERGPEARARRALHRRLLAHRREEPALRPGAAHAEVEHDERGGWIRQVMRPRAGPSALVWLHAGRAAARVRAPATGGPWRLLLSTEDEAFGGVGTPVPDRLAPGEELDLPPRAALLYREAA